MADPLDEFRAQNAKTGPKQFAFITLDLSVERLSALRDALADPTIQSAAIRRVLLNWGITVGAQTVQRHRPHSTIERCRCDFLR